MKETAEAEETENCIEKHSLKKHMKHNMGKKEIKLF